MGGSGLLAPVAGTVAPGPPPLLGASRVTTDQIRAAGGRKVPAPGLMGAEEIPEPAVSIVLRHAEGHAAAGRGEADRLASDETVYAVAAYTGRRLLFPSQQLLVLGSQRLSELRDALTCVADATLRCVMPGDAPAEGAPRPGFIFAEGVFYNDGPRAPPAAPAAGGSASLAAGGGAAHEADGSAVGVVAAPAPAAGAAGPGPSSSSGPLLDYSAPILAHAAARRAAITGPQGGTAQQQSLLYRRPRFGHGAYRAASMPATEVGAVALRAGTPYVYCHAGACEHTLAVTDVRMLHPADPQLRSAYPLQVYAARSHKRKCSICTTYSAVKARWRPDTGPRTLYVRPSPPLTHTAETVIN